MRFCKIVGSGNDFVVTDNRDGSVKDLSSSANKLCNRKSGIGADGLLLLENSSVADFKMRMFNPDGSEAEMCGNGLRCILRFAKDVCLFKKNAFSVETLAGLYSGSISGSQARVSMNILSRPRLNMDVPLAKGVRKAHFIDTGVPHAVIVTNNVEAVNLAEEGKEIRFHELFSPRGTNVDWIQIVDRSTIKIRTYERGVEAETLSCGTGSLAGALIAFLLGKAIPPLSVITASGETIKTYFDKSLKKVEIEGSTTITFSGTTDIV